MPTSELILNKSNVRRRRWLSLTARMLVVAITLGSFLPGALKAFLGTHPGHHVNAMHRIYHFGAFGMTAAALFLSTERLNHQLRVMLFIVLWVFAIEVTQYLTRMTEYFEWEDIRDDFLAVAVAFVLVRLLISFGSRSRSV